MGGVRAVGVAPLGGHWESQVPGLAPQAEEASLSSVGLSAPGPLQRGQQRGGGGVAGGPPRQL